MRKNLWLRILWAFVVGLLMLAITDTKSYAGKTKEEGTSQEDLKIPVKQINFMFGIKDEDSLSQKITFLISGETMKEMGDQIQKYMDDNFSNAGISDLHMESGPEEDVMEYSYIRYYSKFDACDVLFASQLGSRNVAFHMEDRSEYFSPFSFAMQLTLDFDLPDCFIGEDGGAIPCNFGVEKTYAYKYFITDSVEEAKGWNSKYSRTDSTGTCDLIYETDYVGDTIHFPLWILNENKVRYIDVEMDRDGERWSQTSTFTFDKTVTEKLANLIRERFEEIASGFKAEKSGTKIQVAGEWEEKDFKLVITQKGEKEELERSSALLFGSEKGPEYSRETSFWKIRKKESYKGEIDYSKILDKVPINFKITYQVPVGAMASCNYCSYENWSIEEGFLKVSTGEYYVNLDYEGVLADGRAAALWTGAAVIFLVFGRIAGKAICRRYRKSHEIGKKQAFFCSKCGTLMKSESDKCPKCGYVRTK